jgi:hypothetical protein
LKKFWVGLMDGDGSIQVNHWRSKNLQYRLVINLKHHPQNIYMLNLIKKEIGGRVVYRKEDFILWVVDNKKLIVNIIKIFEEYPPITFRLSAQLSFMKNCLLYNDINWYFNQRDLKYIYYQQMINKNFDYFNEWLSGFIEAEGCFSIRENNHSFSIGQNKDKYILEQIKTHFEINNKIRLIKDNFWLIEIYRKSTLLNIIKHCEKYPLLGEKFISYNNFKNKIL